MALNVTTNGVCSGKSVSWNIWRDNGLLGRQSVKITPVPVMIAGSTASASWVAEYVQGPVLGLFGPPNFYFEANVVGDGTIFK